MLNFSVVLDGTCFIFSRHCCRFRHHFLNYIVQVCARITFQLWFPEVITTTLCQQLLCANKYIQNSQVSTYFKIPDIFRIQSGYFPDCQIRNPDIFRIQSGYFPDCQISESGKSGENPDIEKVCQRVYTWKKQS